MPSFIYFHSDFFSSLPENAPFQKFFEVIPTQGNEIISREKEGKRNRERKRNIQRERETERYRGGCMCV